MEKEWFSKGNECMVRFNTMTTQTAMLVTVFIVILCYHIKQQKGHSALITEDNIMKPLLILCTVLCTVP